MLQVSYTNLVQKLGFTPKENTSGIFQKKYADGYSIEIDFSNEKLDYGNLISADKKPTQIIIKSIPIDKLVHEKLTTGETNNLLPTVIDYAAGSGHFITESMHELQRIIDKTNPNDFIEATAKKIKVWKEDHFDWAYQYVYGIEKDYRLVKVGKVGCYLHGDGLAKIVHSDGLRNFAKSEDFKDLLKKTDKDFPQDNKQFDINNRCILEF